MKALVPSDGAGTRSRPSMPTSAAPPLSVAGKAVARVVVPSVPSLSDESTSARALRPAPRVLPHPDDAHVPADQGGVRIGS